MAYDNNLAGRVREYLAEIPDLEIEEKTMFNVLNFMVDKKTCVCVSGEKLMLRFDQNYKRKFLKKMVTKRC
jgi:hypothetical protein